MCSETMLQAAPDRLIQLNQCGSFLLAPKAAAHRFRNRPIEIHARRLRRYRSVPDAHRRAPRSRRPSHPLGIDDATVERYWDDSIQP
jgi:hypothetical protein